MAVDLTKVSQRRRLYITLALKRVRPGSGSSRRTLGARTWRQAVFNLSAIVTVPFVVVGGVATRLYAPERTTDNLKILVRTDDAGRLYQDLNTAGGRRVGRFAVGGSEWRLPDGTTLDVLESDAVWAREAVENPVAAPDGSAIVRLPYLVLMKMIASRGIDIGDLTRMLGGAGEESLEQVRQVITTYLPDGSEDLESMILLGRLEQGQASVRLSADGD